ncbi:hypothetical protein W97_07280 [Coniosporium apollinis CBS 100218]|uniref:Hydrophobin n=1 Tax=Coniosporium apollinis (strain CBS 100218) TaxID=1168221 RepID=R7Z2K6_CONA1|nr:uncharacterized protein W97_07280 [Coniosporium apollinis CBS 100218]EON68131.1 hypothetical protein W97_07280 [Coniosporium apollinis CBS 100218]
MSDGAHRLFVLAFLMLSLALLVVAQGTQFITGPCTSDANCASGCCGFNSGKCAGPIIAQERDGGCGFGDAQPNDIAARLFRVLSLHLLLPLLLPLPPLPLTHDHLPPARGLETVLERNLSLVPARAILIALLAVAASTLGNARAPSSRKSVTEAADLVIGSPMMTQLESFADCRGEGCDTGPEVRFHAE